MVVVVVVVGGCRGCGRLWEDVSVCAIDRVYFLTSMSNVLVLV
jgi:hypothetical protein